MSIGLGIINGKEKYTIEISDEDCIPVYLRDFKELKDDMITFSICSGSVLDLFGRSSRFDANCLIDVSMFASIRSESMLDSETGLGLCFKIRSFRNLLLTIRFIF